MQDEKVLSLPGPSDLLGESWKVYQLKWKYFVKLILFSTVIGVGVFTVIGIFVLITATSLFKITDLNHFISQLGNTGTNLPSFPPLNSIGPMFFVGIFSLVMVFLIWLLFQSWSQLAFLMAVVSEEVLSIKETYTRAWQKFGSYFWVTFLVGLVVFTGYMLFFIPGIILSVFLSLVGFVVLIENVSGFRALARSKAYVSGHGWQVFTRLAMLSLISIIVSLLGSYLSNNISPSLGLIFNLLLILVINPVFAIYTYLIYRHLKSGKGEVVEGATILYKIFAFLPIVFLALAAYFGWQIFSSKEFMNTLQKELKRNPPTNYTGSKLQTI